MFHVTFKFEHSDDVSIYAAPGENLLEVARKANVAIDAPCSGNGSCGKCRVKLLSGQVQTQPSRHISQEEFDAGWRLACTSKVMDDTTVLVPDISSAYRDRMRVADLDSKKEIEIFQRIKENIIQAGIPLENHMSSLLVEMSPPSLDDTMPDNERLSRAICALTGADRVKISYFAMKKLPDVLRENDFKVKCVIKYNKEGTVGRPYVFDVTSPEDKAPICGLAIDIGTTTVAALIVDMETGNILAKASSGNGQIRYGADVINRIIESTRANGRSKLQRAVIGETINPLIDNMCRSIGLDRLRIFRVCVASNTTMNHLFAGISANPLRMEPFIPAFFETDSLNAQDLGLHAHPNARICISPNIGSYVGGDITSGTLASMIWNKEEMSLFIDLGTNGELVFGNSDFMMSCACSAGPAFEGGDISCGMRATTGAIDSCTIDPVTMEPTLSVIGTDPETDEPVPPVGICGSGIIDIISELYRCGIINSKGLFVREGERIVRDEHGMGAYVLAWQKETGTQMRDISINEVDIDNFIRAKGAIFSAINVMLSSLGFDVSVIDHVYVAGGIGSGINMRNAVNIGMFPDLPLEKFTYIGNSSLSGAYCILLSKAAEEKVAQIARNMTYLELSNEPSYMDEFVAACFLPHTNASLFPSVQQVKLDGKGDAQ